MGILQLFWLGPPRLDFDGHPLRLEMRKTLALLAYLSLSPQSPTRETLASLFWPEYDQQRALSNLRRSLSSLARSLPPGALEADREKLGLHREDWLKVDVDDFRGQLAFAGEHSHPANRACPACVASLEKAVAVYKGDFLEGFNLKDCPEFDEWQFFQRDSLRSEYAAALEKLAAFFQGQGEWEKAIVHARRRVALDGLNEPAQRMLISLFNQSGQRSLALRQYEILVGLLRHELGQPPEPETLSLYQGLLSSETFAGPENRALPTLSVSRVPEPLIKTKLFVPPLRRERVARPRLLALLDACSQRSLTLLSAPAGYGKTTLLASWAAQNDLPLAWFSIDEADNDPVRFVTYLVAALETILPPQVSAQFQAFTQSLQPSVRPMLVQLINYLAAESEPFILILDDYQFIHSMDVHNALAFLLEKIPPCMRLVIATRSDPPFSLARLRAHDQMTEIRMSDLRFSLDESAGFLKQVMSLRLSNEDVSALEARTEGWIAGLQMAALAIRNVASQPAGELKTIDSAQAISRFIQAFSGSHRYILDYLGEEVLSRQPGPIRRFLLQTSILGRLSGPLCDAVTAAGGSHKILEELEKENLFLVPLDGERHWYRYHHLFAELLRFKTDEILSQRSEPEGEGLPAPEELHLRAAGWLEKNQLFGEAVRHYMIARKSDRAAVLIEAQAYSMLLTTGQIYTLQEWLAGLPEDLVLSRPRLNIAKAWILIVKDQFTAAAEQLETAWQAAREQQRAETGGIFGEIALVRGALAELSTRDFETMRSYGLMAWDHLPLEDAMLRGLAAWLLGASYLYEGDAGHAESYFAQAIQLCQEAGNTFFTSVAILDLSTVLREQGRYREAYRLLQQTLRKLSSGSRRSHPSLGYLYIGISRILLAWNELEEAERQLMLGIDLVTQDLPGEVLITGISLLAHLKLAHGKREEALRLAEECLQKVEAYPLPYIPAIVKANMIGFWLRVGNQERIEEWLGCNRLAPTDTIRYLHDPEYTALAKVLIWQGRTQEALKVLAQLNGLARSQGRHGKLAYVLALQALALKQSGCSDQALVALEASLALAQSEGTIRAYIDEGRPMEELLRMGTARGLWRQTYLDGYVSRLLKAIQQDQAQLGDV